MISLFFRESLCESGEVSGFPEKWADLRGSPGNFRGSPGKKNFQGSLGNFQGTFGLRSLATVRELPAKSLGNFRGSPGNFWGSPGNFRGLSRSSGEPDSLPATRQICLQVLPGKHSKIQKSIAFSQAKEGWEKGMQKHSLIFWVVGLFTYR